jgi:hypothetical protein
MLRLYRGVMFGYSGRTKLLVDYRTLDAPYPADATGGSNANRHRESFHR